MKAKRLPRAEVRSLLPITTPASRWRVPPPPARRARQLGKAQERRAAPGSWHRRRADGSRDRSRWPRIPSAAARPWANPERCRQGGRRALPRRAPPNRLTWPLPRSSADGAGVAQQQLDGGEALRPVGVERVEGAGLDQALELAAVEALGVEPPGEIEQILERAVGLALRHQLPHRLRAHALDRGQRIADRRALRRLLDREDGVGAVDVGRQQLDAEPVAFLAEDVELVGVADDRGSSRRR